MVSPFILAGNIAFPRARWPTANHFLTESSAFIRFKPHNLAVSSQPMRSTPRYCVLIPQGGVFGDPLKRLVANSLN